MLFLISSYYFNKCFSLEFFKVSFQFRIIYSSYINISNQLVFLLSLWCYVVFILWHSSNFLYLIVGRYFCLVNGRIQLLNSFLVYFSWIVYLNNNSNFPKLQYQLNCYIFAKLLFTITAQWYIIKKNHKITVFTFKETRQMIILIIILILIALIAAAVFLVLHIVPILVVFFSICGILLILSPPKHGRR